jgi:hypothetical protein
MLKHDLLARPETRNLPDNLWQRIKSVLGSYVQTGSFVLKIHLGRSLADILAG